MGLESWAGSIDLDTPAGRLLRRLDLALPEDRPLLLTVFGSAPLQIAVDAALTSADVGVFIDEGEADLASWVEQAGLGPGQTEFHIQVGNRAELPLFTALAESRADRSPGSLHPPIPASHRLRQLLERVEKGVDAWACDG
jgi:hypothetical protein